MQGQGGDPLDSGSVIFTWPTLRFWRDHHRLMAGGLKKFEDSEDRIGDAVDLRQEALCDYGNSHGSYGQPSTKRESALEVTRC